MPTVEVSVPTSGFEIVVNIIEDGEGPHVHVWKAGTEYRVGLLRGTARLWTIGGEKSTAAEARRAEAHVQRNIRACWREWKKWHP